MLLHDVLAPALEKQLANQIDKRHQSISELELRRASRDLLRTFIYSS